VNLVGTVGDAETSSSELVVRWYAGEIVVCDSFGDEDGGTTCPVVLEAGPVPITLEVRDPSDSVATASINLSVAADTTEPTDLPNTPPEPPEIQVTPSCPVPGQDLICEIVTASFDAEGTALDYVFEWTLDGVAVATQENTTWPGDTIDGATVAAGVWTCTVVADDGEDVSEPTEVDSPAWGSGRSPTAQLFSVDDRGQIHSIDPQTGVATLVVDTSGWHDRWVGI